MRPNSKLPINEEQYKNIVALKIPAVLDATKSPCSSAALAHAKHRVSFPKRLEFDVRSVCAVAGPSSADMVTTCRNQIPEPIQTHQPDPSLCISTSQTVDMSTYLVDGGPLVLGDDCVTPTIEPTNTELTMQPYCKLTGRILGRRSLGSLG